MKHNSVAPLKSIRPIRLTFSIISIVFAIALTLAAFGVPVGTSWTYQGQLRRSGAAYTGTCNFQFTLWDAASGGVGNTINRPSVNVANGLFTVVLDFGDMFKGDARWLGTSVQCSGDGGFTALDPRQPVTAAPYALSLRPGAQINGSADFASMLSGNNSGAGFGILGSGQIGLYGSSANPSGFGVVGENSTGYGMKGKGSVGVFGQPIADSGTGVYGDAQNVTNGFGVVGRGKTGVLGETYSSAGVGVSGYGSGANTVGVYGSTFNGWAGRFNGPVDIIGNLFVAGSVSKQAGSFKIDHPLDPANKFLSHSFVESPEMMNIYNGNVTTDATGSATVTLPAYFSALNRDFRYQLTVMGQFAQAIVSRKIIADNTFTIRTDKLGVEVSWQVTGVRQDAYAKENPIVVEEAKSAAEDGKYLYPAGFGAGEEQRIGHSNGLGAPDRSSPAKKDQAEGK
ncbi:MAG: hypothetical protein ABIR71_08270 [Chthoniobacterales bacterium]